MCTGRMAAPHLAPSPSRTNGEKKKKKTVSRKPEPCAAETTLGGRQGRRDDKVGGEASNLPRLHSSEEGNSLGVKRMFFPWGVVGMHGYFSVRYVCVCVCGDQVTATLSPSLLVSSRVLSYRKNRKTVLWPLVAFASNFSAPFRREWMVGAVLCATLLSRGPEWRAVLLLGQ